MANQPPAAAAAPTPGADDQDPDDAGNTENEDGGDSQDDEQYDPICMVVCRKSDGALGVVAATPEQPEDAATPPGGSDDAAPEGGAASPEPEVFESKGEVLKAVLEHINEYEQTSGAPKAQGPQGDAALQEGYDKG